MKKSYSSTLGGKKGTSPPAMEYSGVSGAGFEKNPAVHAQKTLLESREPYGIGLSSHAGVLKSTETPAVA
jgi:hypothetical protein